MRKITQNMRNAFLSSQSFSESNTQVMVNQNAPCGVLTQVYLHGNLIAEHTNEGLKVTNCGWFTNVTKERLNALPNVSIQQKKGKWYLNGNEWDGQWVKLG